jgi:hypothetical protein
VSGAKGGHATELCPSYPNRQGTSLNGGFLVNLMG